MGRPCFRVTMAICLTETRLLSVKGPAVSALEQDIVNTTQREALVERVVDTSVLPMESYGPVEARLFVSSLELEVFIYFASQHRAALYD